MTPHLLFRGVLAEIWWRLVHWWMKAQIVLSQFRFNRPKPDGAIQVLNERSYLMGEYSQRTGKVSWQRVVLATQREHVENWLQEHYPITPVAPKGSPAGKTRNAASRSQNA
jgi:hypothetical protein